MPFGAQRRLDFCCVVGCLRFAGFASTRADSASVPRDDERNDCACIEGVSVYNSRTMQLGKRIAVGAAFVLIGTIVYLYFALYRGLPPNATPGLDGIWKYTFDYSWYRLGALVVFLIGCAVVRSKK
jgi:hypothetical protein